MESVCSTSFTNPNTSINISICSETICDNCGHSSNNHYDGSCHKIVICCGCHSHKCPCDSYKPRQYQPYYQPYTPPIYPDVVPYPPMTPNPVWH